MKVAIRLIGGDDAERVLMKVAGFSAFAHLAALVVFSILPRFMTPPPMPRATIAEIVPASALSLPGGSPQAKQDAPTPTQRAEAAKKAQQRPEPPRPVEKKAPPPTPDTKTPPLEPVKRPVAKPEPSKLVRHTALTFATFVRLIWPSDE